jgi:hypothetical protein
MRVQAKSKVHNKQLIATNLDYEFLYKHFNTLLGFARINLTSKTCTCHTYLDKGVCKHNRCLSCNSNIFTRFSTIAETFQSN